MATMMIRATPADSTGYFCTRQPSWPEAFLSAPTTRGRPRSGTSSVAAHDLGPMNPNIAGRRVRAATMVRATPMAAAPPIRRGSSLRGRIHAEQGRCTR